MPQTTREVIIPESYANIIVSPDAQRLSSVFPEHWHLFAEFLLAVEDGQGVRVGGVDYVLNKGDILLIWPTELHSFTHASYPASYLLIQFDIDLISSCHDVYMCFHRMQKIHLVSPDNTKLYPTLIDCYHQILEIHRSAERFAETRIRIHLAQALLKIAEVSTMENLPVCKASPDVSETYLKIKDSCAYINDHCSEDISEESIASRTGFSTYYFSRMFKKYAGESFCDYLNRQRLSRSLKLLQFDSIPVTEVAFSAGYQSISNFNKVFKKNMGISPNEYRKLHQRDRQSEEPSSAANDPAL